MNITWVSYNDFRKAALERDILAITKKTAIKRPIIGDDIHKLFRMAAHEVSLEQSMIERQNRISEKAKCLRCGRMVQFINGHIISHRKHKNGRGGWCINNNAVDNEPIEVQIDSQK